MLPHARQVSVNRSDVLKALRYLNRGDPGHPVKWDVLGRWGWASPAGLPANPSIRSELKQVHLSEPRTHLLDAFDAVGGDPEG